MSITSVIINGLFKVGDTVRDRGLVSPENVRSFENLDYYGDKNNNHLLDVYCPEGNDKPLPVIISVHGGGWVYGNKEIYKFYCMSLVSYGFAVVNFNYRLAPKHKFPAALEDVNAVFHWVKENSEKFLFDLNNLFIVGDSAGAHFASQYATITTNEKYEKMFGFEIPKIRIKAMGLNCGMFDPLDRVRNDGDKLVNKLLNNLLRDYLGKEIYKYEKEMDFQSNVTQTFPPVFVTCSVNDILVGIKPVLVDKLNCLGISNIYKEYGYGYKTNGHVFHLDIRKDEAIKLNNEQMEFFRQHMI